MFVNYNVAIGNTELVELFADFVGVWPRARGLPDSLGFNATLTALQALAAGFWKKSGCSMRPQPVDFWARDHCHFRPYLAMKY